MSELSNWDAKTAGKQFARKVGNMSPCDIAAIKANAKNLLTSVDPDERKVGEYHMAFCLEIEQR